MANIIASGDYWRLEDDGVLYVYCIGDMPYSSMPPWDSYREQIANVVISPGVTNIERYAFYNCTSLVHVTLPDGVTSIGAIAFYNCTSLVNVTLPDSVISIGNSAFWGCTALASVIIPDGATTIGQAAFRSCANLTSITIPDSVTSMGKSAFTECTALASVMIGSGVSSIETFVFSDCGALNSVVIPNSVTSIGDYAFQSCSNLTDVYYSGTQTQWSAITIGKSNTRLTRATFHYNSTGPVTLSSIEITTPPAKTAYTSGEMFNPAGMVVTATYSDNTTAAVSGYSVSPSGVLTISDISVTVSYTEDDITETATVAITVEPVTLSSIAVTTPPTKTTYSEWDVFDPSGMVVTATYSDNTTAAVSGYSVSPSGALTVSDTVITLTYAEDGVTVTATVAITVTVQSFSTNWPRTARDVMREIAYRIGAPLDPRTEAVLGTDEIEDTALKMSMREVAGYIAAMYGGNWTVTDEGYLYLVPLAMAARVLGDENGVPILFGEALLLV